MKYLKAYNKQDILKLTRLRRFETKLGERIHACTNAADPEKSIRESTARFVLLGVPEEIGNKANLGKGGTHTAWFPFLDSFLNIQSNDFLEGNEILLLGHFDF